MPEVREYDRIAARNYAVRWALSRNPEYYDFNDIGGDCTNFASQCIYAGSGVMNFSKDNGWYYIDLNNRSPSWSSTRFLYEFLVSNKGVGPFGSLSSIEKISPGDIIQLGDENNVFYHTIVVLSNYTNIYVASHSYDALFKPLSSYSFYQARFIKIDGVRYDR